MTTSSQPTNFSITSTNDYLSSTDVITITGSSSTDTIIIDDSIGTITLDYGAASTSTYIRSEEHTSELQSHSFIRMPSSA